ncbi:MAG: glucokinase [Gemmatimonadota bacterium]|nr:glucokinase [Gemmatimonadota bacterium]
MTHRRADLSGDDTDGLLVLDVGATYTRISISGSLDNFDASLPPLRRRLSTVEELISLVASVVAEQPSIPRTLVAGFAGAVRPNGDAVRMTNWEQDGSLVQAASFRALGFEEVHLINDAKAAAHGLIDLIGRDRTSVGQIPGGSRLPEAGNRVLIVPGTGLGSAALIHTEGKSADWHVVATEAQHGPATVNGSDASDLLAALTKRLGNRPSWEDCVSGRGLESLYALTGHGRRSTPASEVAERARAGDPEAARALCCYYAVAGAFAQSLALAFLSYGGVCFAGAATRANREFIPESPLEGEFYENCVMGEWLLKVPLVLIPQELNLRGALAFVRNRLSVRG